MPTTKHTPTMLDHLPTPWRVDPTDPREIIADDGAHDPWNVARTHSNCGGLVERDRSIANAAFIVLAVNAHAALVAALEQIASGEYDKFGAAMIARTALALAEGGAA